MPQDQRLTHPASELDNSFAEIAARLPAVEGGLREQTNLREYLDILLKRKWLIGGIVLITTLLVTLQMYRLPSVYEAQTTIRIEPKNESFLRSKDIVINTGTDPAYRQTQLRLLENPHLMRQLALALDLPQTPDFLGQSTPNPVVNINPPIVANASTGDGTGATMPAGSLAMAESLTVEQRAQLTPYVNALLANLSFESVVGTNLVHIRFRHANPALAMKVTDTLARLFIENDTYQETIGTQNTATQLARQLAELQVSIKKQEDERLAYIKSHELPLSEGKGQNLTAERLGTLSGELLAAENERQNLQTAYEAARRSKNPWVVPQIQENKDVQELRLQIRGLERKRVALLTKYTPAWPEVVQLDEELKRLKQDLEHAPQEIITAMRLRYETALEREQGLRQTYFKEHGTANQQSLAGIELSDLTQKLETDKQLFNTLFQRQKELEINSSGRSPNVSIETPSELPVAAIGPARVKNIFFSFLLSLVAGVGLSILLHKFDGAVESADEVTLYTQLPILAVVPATRKGFLSARKKETASLVGDSTMLALTEDVRSPVSEAYRHLRTALLKSSNIRAPKSILVTSGMPLEGKTTTAVNAATIFALTGKKVLLIDCDLRRPRVQTHFGFSESPGLSDCLSGQLEPSLVLRTFERLPNLKVLTAGQVPANPAELLGSDEMCKLLETLGHSFDHIIIDSPPAISFTDAAVLSTLVDGVLIVVRESKSSRKMVSRVKQQLLDLGANIYGIILNDARTNPSDYYYDGHYATSNYRNFEMVETHTVEHTIEHSVQTSAWVGIESSEIEQAFKKFRREVN